MTEAQDAPWSWWELLKLFLEIFCLFSAAKLCSQAAAGEPDVGEKSNSDDENVDFHNSRV